MAVIIQLLAQCMRTGRSSIILIVHCPKNNKDLRIKTEPVTVEACRYNGIYVWFLGKISFVHKSQTYTVTGRFLC